MPWKFQGMIRILKKRLYTLQSTLLDDDWPSNIHIVANNLNSTKSAKLGGLSPNEITPENESQVQELRHTNDNILTVDQMMKNQKDYEESSNPLQVKQSVPI